MARRAKVSTISAKSSSVRFEAGMEKALESMLGFWKTEFSNVLCERPDLIVVPECCDWDSGFNAEQRTIFTKYRADRILSYFAETARKTAAISLIPPSGPEGTGKTETAL